MISEYGKQIIAFFHFMFKHIFEIEFGVRVSIEILIFIAVTCQLLKKCLKIINKVRTGIGFICQELILPFRVRLFEKMAFSTNNPAWQERANKIKDEFNEKKNNGSKNYKNKSYKGRCIFIYIILTAWIIGLHYYGTDKRNNYEVFFLGEDAILTFEEWTVNTFFYTDENAIECFFHDKIEKS